MLALLASPFSYYAAGFGAAGLSRDLSGETYLFTAGSLWANASVFLHMAAGAALPVLAPLQVLLGLRGLWPRLHRWLGRGLIVVSGFTALAGLVFIAVKGTIGGAPMDAGFTLYGVLMLAAAVQTVRHARAGRYAPHRRWALRLFVLAMGSWLYRVQYGLWALATGRAASTPEFTGAFDLFMNVGFYLPWLLLLELAMRRRPSAP